MKPWRTSGKTWGTASAASWAQREKIWCSGSAIHRPGWCLSAKGRERTRTKKGNRSWAMPAGCSTASSRPWGSSGRRSTSATWSNAAPPATAIRSRTRSQPVHRSCCGSCSSINPEVIVALGKPASPDPAGDKGADLKAARQVPRFPRHPAHADLSSVLSAAQRREFGFLLGCVGGHDPGAAAAQAAGTGEEQESVTHYQGTFHLRTTKHPAVSRQPAS